MARPKVGFRQPLTNWTRDMAVRTNGEMRYISKALQDEVVDTTPVDTGFARSKWVLRFLKPRGKYKIANAVLSNAVHYIVFLNYGSSKQAPKGIIWPAIKKISGLLKKRPLIKHVSGVSGRGNLDRSGTTIPKPKRNIKGGF